MLASAMAQGLREGRLDPLDLLAEVYAKAEAVGDPAIFTETTRPRAEAEAMAARTRLRAGLPASLLDGVPVAWKDLFDLRGRVTTAGSVVLAGGPPAAEDAALVAAGARAGLVTVGALNMTEFAFSGIGLNPHFGTPRNPNGTGPARSPGGSSSASGVVVAGGDRADCLWHGYRRIDPHSGSLQRGGGLQDIDRPLPDDGRFPAVTDPRYAWAVGAQR